MKEKGEHFSDPLIDEVRERRRRLVREHGGLRGWVAHLRRKQEKHPESLVPPKARSNRRSRGPRPR